MLLCEYTFFFLKGHGCGEWSGEGGPKVRGDHFEGQRPVLHLPLRHKCLL